ncbi:DUF6930 domain-containing protein [[Phormidium] sp. ETS-05]|uniref:DUF6930 domain-containing protein n=1 Tax=[Phormidium] sp. ETS-05 TaxID=222819 RepID=UPI0018EF087E|nr:hypothetical protein [[Phormidium] sp. ETS-05]
MAALNRTTQHRLQKLPLIPSVWEGDRRPIEHTSPVEPSIGDSSAKSPTHCIIWVDGSQGIIRAIESVDPSAGPHAIVRTLLRAMEAPQSPAKPGRPQKIIVKDRELQFFLRGALQELDITIEYVKNLPLIDQIFQELQQATHNQPPHLPPQLAPALEKIAQQIWQDAPWDILQDHHVIAIHITPQNGEEPSSLYAVVMGKLGLDHGILLYRTLESIKQFRASVLENISPVEMEEAFLSQDCLFLTFAEETEEFALSRLDRARLIPHKLGPAPAPTFGTLHPLEGLRGYLYEEEAINALVALEALHRFFTAHRRQIKQWAEGYHVSSATTQAISATIPLELPPKSPESKQFTAEVSTLPALAIELANMEIDLDEDDSSDPKALLDDLVPTNSFLSIGAIPWHTVELLRTVRPNHQEANVTTAGDGLPIVIIQTTRPKAKAMIEQLQQAGGIKGICFNLGEDPLKGSEYDLGIIQTEDGNLHLFGEFSFRDPIHQAARLKWDERGRHTKGYCGLIIAMGLTGKSRGNPQIKDMLALFETRALSSQDLNLGILQRIPMPF